MSRGFDGSVTGLQDESGFVPTAYPMCMAGWFRHDSKDARQTLLMACFTDVDNVEQAGVQLKGDASDQLVYLFRDDSTTVFFTGATTVGTNEWHHFGMRSRGSNPKHTLYLDGVQDATNNQSVDFPGSDLWTVGHRNNGGTADGFFRNSAGGGLGELGVWNVDIGADGFAELATGVSPPHVRPDGLIKYWDLRRTLRESMRGDVLVEISGTPTTVETHPHTIKYFLPLIVGTPSAAGADVTFSATSAIVALDTGLLLRDRLLKATSAIVASNTGKIALDVSLKATSAVVALDTGLLFKDRLLKATSAIVASNTGLLLRDRLLKATSAIVASNTGLLFVDRFLKATSAIVASNTGLLLRDRFLKATSAIVALTTGVLTVAADVFFAATSAVVALNTGLLFRDRFLKVTSAIVASNTGLLFRDRLLLSTSAIVASNTGLLLRDRLFKDTAAIVASNTGRLVLDLVLKATQPIVASTTGALQGAVVRLLKDYYHGIHIFSGDFVGGAIYYGDRDTDGTWRMQPSGADLLVQVRVAGVYTTKHTFTNP